MKEKVGNTLVVIVTYNGMKWIERCLDSVVNSSIPLDAYIVDNGSTDGSQKFITENYPQFIFKQSATNSGFGAANNIGLKYAIERDYDYVYLLNQDAWVMTDTIATLIEINKANSNYGILSPLQINGKMDALDKNFSTFSTQNSEMLSDYIFGSVKDVYATDFVMAAHWLMSKECILNVGGFSSVFNHYGEDSDYLHRVEYYGYEIGIVPSAVAVHDREFRELTKEKDLYMLTPIFLAVASNLSNSYMHSFAKAYMGLLNMVLRMIIEYRDIRIIVILVTIFFNARKIHIGRKVSKNTKCPFLNI